MSSEKITDLYKIIDADRDGKISINELVDYLKHFGPTLLPTEVETLMEMLDLKEVSSLDKQDFIVFLTKKVKLTIPKKEVESLFKAFDPQNTGKVNFSNS